MSLFSRRQTRERLWLAETTASALEVASRCPDVDEILRFWAREIAKSTGPERVALFLVEGDRWLRVLPEGQTGEAPSLTEAALASAASAPHPLRIDSLGSGDPSVVLVRYSVRDSWKGVLALWKFGRRFRPSRIRHAEELAGAIARCLKALRKSEISQERAIASERSRWAAELHDGHLQTLSSAKIHAEVCLSLEEKHQEVCLAFGQSEPGSRLRSGLTRLHQLLGDTVREARQFLLELRSLPATAEQFLPWLRAYADDFTRENGVRVDVRIEGEGELSPNEVGEATWLVREALTNVRKHAKAASVRIVVVFGEHGASLSVSDDGVGFDARATLERVLDSSHNGLIGLQYRAESVGGEMRLRSEPGKGTTLVFRLPRVSRGTGSLDRRRRSASAPVPAPSEPAGSADLSVRDSIRATLSEAITSFLKEEGSSPAQEPPEAT